MTAVYLPDAVDDFGRRQVLDPSPATIDPEARRILEIAREMLAANGYAGFKVPNLVKRAGISTRRLYRHFPTKLHLLRALYEDEAAGIERRIGRAVSSADGPADKLDVWICELIRPAVDTRLRRRALLYAAVRMDVIAEFGVEVWPVAEVAPLGIVGIINEGVASGCFAPNDPVDAGRAIYALCTGTMFGALATDPDTAAKSLELARSTARAILNMR